MAGFMSGAMIKSKSDFLWGLHCLKSGWFVSFNAKDKKLMKEFEAFFYADKKRCNNEVDH